MICVIAMLGTFGIVALNSDQEVSGLENFDTSYCSYSLTSHLFPSEDFLLSFDYLEGSYHYRIDRKFLVGDRAISIASIKYNPEEYRQAKEFCEAEFTKTDEHQYQIGNYIFIEHLCYESTNNQGQIVLGCEYPSTFNMYAYCDEKYELLFLGYHNGNPDSAERILAETDFAMFFQSEFSEYYSLF